MKAIKVFLVSFFLILCTSLLAQSESYYVCWQKAIDSLQTAWSYRITKLDNWTKVRTLVKHLEEDTNVRNIIILPRHEKPGPLPKITIENNF